MLLASRESVCSTLTCSGRALPTNICRVSIPCGHVAITLMTQTLRSTTGFSTTPFACASAASSPPPGSSPRCACISSDRPQPCRGSLNALLRRDVKSEQDRMLEFEDVQKLCERLNISSASVDLQRLFKVRVTFYLFILYLIWIS